MQRYKLSVSIVWLSALGCAFACSDDTIQGGAAVLTETGGGEGTADAAGDGDGMEGQDAEAEGDGDPATGDGDGDPTTGDGDGDPATGDGDGDSTTGDGDGDSTTGDGDGDSTTGDGDGDGDSTTGDGDGEPARVCGNGIVEAGEDCDDGNVEVGDGCSDACTFEAAPKLYFCGNKVYQCGDGIDNDMDGLVDLADPECTTPCDNDEGSFQTDLPGQNLDCKTDCYFDANSGAGDDDCEGSLVCDPVDHADLGCAYNPGSPMCTDGAVSDVCKATCWEPLVPNGCDCFGCCEIDGQFVYLGGNECDLGSLEACSSCTQVEACTNECNEGSCEVCFGQTPADLPPECPEPSCPQVMSCFNSADCLDGEFCQTGCCVPII